MKQAQIGLVAVAALFGGCTSHPANVGADFRGVFKATGGSVYSETMSSAILRFPTDASPGAKGSMRAAKGRLLTASEVKQLKTHLEAFDRNPKDEAVSACAQNPKVYFRLDHPSGIVDVSVDPDCGHLEFWDAKTRKHGFVWGGDSMLGIIDLARRIDPVAMKPIQPLTP